MVRNQNLDAQPMVDHSERRKCRSAPKVRLTVQNNHALRARLESKFADIAFGLFAAAMFLCFDGQSAQSAPPLINTLNPTAAQRGTKQRLCIEGRNLAKASQIYVPFKAEVTFDGAIDEQTCFQIKPDEDTPPGVYPVRVRSTEGISNLRLFIVTDVPVVRAKEPNGTYKNGRIQLDQAQTVEWPAMIAGKRLVYNLDLWRFSVKAGQRLLVTTQTRQIGLTVDPILRLRDSRGRTLVVRHDTPGLRADERLDYTFAEAGDYYIEMRSYGSSGWNNHYLMKIGAFDYARTVFPLGGRRGDSVRFAVLGSDGKTSTVEAQVPSDPWIDRWQLPLEDFPGSLPWKMASGDLPEVFENDDAVAVRDGSGDPKPQEVNWPVTINGHISHPKQGDLFLIDVKPGQHVRVQVDAYFLGSHLDGYLMAYDPIGQKLLAKNDDQRYRGNPDPGLTFQVPEGVHQIVISLRDTLGRGGIEFPYRLTIESGGPDFYLWLGTPQTPYTDEGIGWLKMDAWDTLNLRVGEAVKFPISVRRIGKHDTGYGGPVQGYQGAIRLKVLNLPDGVTVDPIEIPAGELKGELVFKTAAAVPTEPFEVVVVGEATRKDGTMIRRIAERRLYISDPQMTILPWNLRVTKLTCVTASETIDKSAK